MQAKPVVRLDDDQLVESIFEQFKCPVEMIVPYEIHDVRVQNAAAAYRKTRFRQSLWNMDSPWMMAIGGTFILNLIGFCLLFLLSHSARVIGIGFTLFALSMIAAIPLTYMLVVGINLRAGYGPRWWRRFAGPTHIGITELGFKLYVLGKFFYNYPNLAVWKDIKNVDIVVDSIYDVPAVQYRIDSNYTFKDVVLPITGFYSASHLLTVLRHLHEHVEPAMLSERFNALAEAQFAPLLDAYSELTTVASLEAKQ